MKVIAAMLCCLGLFSCAAQMRAYRNQVKRQLQRELLYFKDARTGICYAAVEGVGLATIPCERMPKER